MVFSATKRAHDLLAVLFLLSCLVILFGVLHLQSAGTLCPTKPTTMTKTQVGHIQIQPDSSARPFPKGGLGAVLLLSKTDPPFRYLAYPPEVDFVTNRLKRTGIYEEEMSSFIDRIFPLGVGDQSSRHYVSLDLGGNIGFHSLHIASRGGHVITFEASPDTAWLLRFSAASNGFLVDSPALVEGHGSIVLLEKGASNETGVGRLSRHPNSPGMTSFATDTPFNLRGGRKKGQEGQESSSLASLDFDVPLVRADDVLDELSILSNSFANLRLLKVDVEGYELHALKGVNLARYPFEYVSFELFPALLKSCGTDPVDVIVYVWSHGYRFFDFVLNIKGTNERGDRLDSWEKYRDIGVTEKEVRTWGVALVRKGYKDKGDEFHINLYAKKISG